MMDKLDWIFEFEPLLTKDTYQEISQEEIYTLSMADFLKMPDLDYKSIAKHDATIRSLLN